jgi:predicted transposase/invertase (TIGR01784 family)
MSPKVDFAFRRLFGDERNEELLISLLKSILKENITHVQVKDPNLLPDFFDDKVGILDVRATTDAGYLIDIEIQLTDYAAMRERVLFYWSRLFTSQIVCGERYCDLNKTISIVILDYELIKCDGFHFCFHLIDPVHSITLTDVLEIHVLELTKLYHLKGQDKDDLLISWMKFINARSLEELQMISDANPTIKKAYHALEVLSHNEEARRLYEAREIALLDEALKMQSAEEKGREEGKAIGKEEGEALGLEKGEAIGLEKGKALGKEEGIMLGVQETAKNLVSLGMDDATIMKATGLDAATLKTLRDSVSL